MLRLTSFKDSNMIIVLSVSIACLHSRLSGDFNKEVAFIATRIFGCQPILSAEKNDYGEYKTNICNKKFTSTKETKYNLLHTVVQHNVHSPSHDKKTSALQKHVMPW